MNEKDAISAAAQVYKHSGPQPIAALNNLLDQLDDLSTSHAIYAAWLTGQIEVGIDDKGQMCWFTPGEGRERER